MTIEPPEDQPGTVAPEPIDEALAHLDALDELPVADHPAVFEAIHRVLRDQLAGTPGMRP